MLWLGTCLRLVCISTCSTVMSWSMWSITGRRCCRYQVEHDKLKSICTKRLACWALTLVASLLFYYDHKVHAHAIYALVLSKDGGRSSRCTIWWQWCFGWRWTVGKGVFGGGRRRLTVVGLRQWRATCGGNGVLCSTSALVSTSGWLPSSMPYTPNSLGANTFKIIMLKLVWLLISA